MDPKYYSVPEQRPNGGSPQGADYAPVPPVQSSQVPVQPTYAPAQPSYSPAQPSCSPAQPVYRPVPPVQAPAPRRAACRPAGTRDLVFAGILAVLCILAANFYLWGGLGLAASVVTVLIFLTGASYLLKHRRKITGYSIYCGLAYVIGAGAFLISDGGFLHFLLIHVLLALATVGMMEVMELRADRDSSFRNAGDFFRTLFGLTFGNIGAAFYGIFHRKDEKGETKRRKMGAPLLGFACAIPVLLIVIPLLMSSDEAFDNMLGKISGDTVGELVLSTILGLFAFLLIFSRLFALPKTEKREKAPSDFRGMASVTLCVALAMISLVYVLYLVSQLAYFFDAFSGLLPDGFSVAEYARRGFFEMFTVCAINLVLIFLASLLSRKENGKTPLAIRLFSLFFCIFSLVLISTALSKMFLYIDSFGMTHKRILTSVFMIFLAVMFLAVGLRLFVPKVPYMKIGLITASLLLIATCYVNVDGMIAEYNVTAYQSHKLEEIDMYTMEELDGASAVPWLLELLEDEDRAVRTEAAEQLQALFDEAYLVDWEWTGSSYEHSYRYQPLDWRAYNLAAAKAHQLLWEKRAAFLDAGYIEIS
ncbi:MAG: DUF4173 domain-containing protein [Oscillospiraceae bacterium]|nr:DUF4173 domain-containing protein [Oscillospiraceae bacterium]